MKNEQLDTALWLLASVTEQRDRARDWAANLEAQLAAIEALLSRTGEAVSCGGMTVDSDGCFAGDLATRIRAVLDPGATP